MTSPSDGRLLLLDTHVWVWQILGDRQLLPVSRRRIDQAAINGRLRLSVISFWEIAFLASHNRLRLRKPASVWISESLAAPGPVIEPLSAEIAIEAGELPGGFRSDPADQIIVATARITGATLMTRDSRLLDYSETGHLKVMIA